MSYLRFDRDTPNRQQQRGAAFIVMLVVLVLGIATVLVASLSTAGLKIERDVKTVEALAQAKEALIGEAAIDVDLPSHHYPSSLPCPDTDDNGTSDAGGFADCPQYIGRLPWKTLGLPDLRDATGERLWYVLSRNVRRYASVRPLNSDAAGTLNITGTSPENNLMAIVFAPGATLGVQKRSNTQSALCTTTNTVIAENRCATNYLEGSNGNLDPNLNFQNANANVEFNDQLISISHDQLFTTVEKRVGNEIKNILKTYYTAWGAFPFPAPFTDPSTSSYRGQVGTYEGLLPIADDVKPTWDAAPSIDFSGGGSSDPCYLDDSGGINDVRWKCDDVFISTGETVTIKGTLNNVGRGLWRPHNKYNICEVRAKNSSGTSKLAEDVLDNVVITNSLNADGSATIVFQAKGKAGFGNLDRIELRGILDYTTAIVSNINTSSCPPTSTNAVIPAWLFNNATDGNNWHKLAYYAIAEEYAPGGLHNSCNTTPCMTVNGQNGGSDIPAVVVMTGRVLAGQLRTAAVALCPATGTNIATAACISNYLEGQNDETPMDYIFENQTRSTTFNDQVIIVAP